MQLGYHKDGADARSWSDFSAPLVPAKIIQLLNRRRIQSWCELIGVLLSWLKIGVLCSPCLTCRQTKRFSKDSFGLEQGHQDEYIIGWRHLGGQFKMGLPMLRVNSAYTIDQYLAIERSAEDRHYFLDGEIYAMAGESSAHGDITVNIVLSLGNQLKGTQCRVRTKATKVRSGPILSASATTRGLFSYPDILVICGQPDYHDALQDVILNPKVVVEVLSESTEAFDRGEKFTRYQTWNPSLTDYVLVSQDRPQIEHYQRKEDGAWSYGRATGLDASVKITSIQCSLKLVDAYDRVTFAEE